MRDERKIILISILAGMVLWFLDAVLDPRLYENSGNFLDILLVGGSEHDFLMRGIILASFLSFGLIIARIVKKRRQAEEALGEKTMYLDNILRSATEYAIATTDKDFRITYYNPLAEKFHGFTAKEVIGRTVQEIHTKENIAPARFDEAIENIRKKGEHSYIIEKSTEGGIRYIEARVSGIYDSKGELVGYANFSHDITESRKAEEERENLISQLKKALFEVETLSGLLPICSYCKKIRDDKGYWSQIETYIRKHSKAEFTHSICPECEKRALERLD